MVGRSLDGEADPLLPRVHVVDWQGRPWPFKIYDGLPRRRPHLSPRARFNASIDELCRHIDAIHGATGSHRHVAIGSDFDGFIKPTLPGIEDMRAMRRVEAALRKRYGNADGDLICSGNALRLLDAGWAGRQP